MHQEKFHTDWEKLLAILEKNEEQQQLLISGLSGEERELLHGLQQLKTDKAMLSAMQIDSTKAWHNVAGSLDGRGKVVSAGSTYFRWTRWVAAACLLIVAGAGFYFWFNSSSRQANQYKTVAEALSKHTPAQKVQLILADGNKIEANINQQLKEKDGTAIKWQENGISYDSNVAVPETSGTSILMNTLVVPRGYIQNITLSDGTRIWMNADSKLRFPVQFGKSDRRIELEGEAYLEVKHDANRPFIVSSGNAEVKVLGTSFDVKAYGKKIYTTLVTGRVSFNPSSGDQVLLMPGQQAVYDNTQNPVLVRKVDAEQWTAWRNDELIMDKKTLSELAEMLERRYDVQIAFTDERLKNIEYDGVLDMTDNIVDVLENLEKAARIHFVVKDKTILIEPSLM